MIKLFVSSNSTLLYTTALERDWSFSWYAQSITQSFPTWNWFSCRLIPSLSLNKLAPKPVWRNVFVCFFLLDVERGKLSCLFLILSCQIHLSPLAFTGIISLHQLKSHLVHAETFRLWFLMKIFGIRWCLNWNISGWKASNISSGKWWM